MNKNLRKAIYARSRLKNRKKSGISNNSIMIIAAYGFICRDYKNYSKERFREELNNKHWSVADAKNVNDAWQQMKDNIRSCLDKIAPRITKQIRGKPCPLMTPELKQLQSERDKLHRRHQKSKLPVHKCEYQRKKIFSTVQSRKQYRIILRTF